MVAVYYVPWFMLGCCFRSVAAINLGQGSPDWPAPAFVKEAGMKAINDDANQVSLRFAVQ